MSVGNIRMRIAQTRRPHVHVVLGRNATQLPRNPADCRAGKREGALADDTRFAVTQGHCCHDYCTTGYQVRRALIASDGLDRDCTSVDGFICKPMPVAVDVLVAGQIGGTGALQVAQVLS